MCAGRPATAQQRTDHGQFPFLGRRPNDIAHAGERGVGVGAERGDGADADNDDESEHDGIFDRRWAIFALEELAEEHGNT